MMIGLLVTITVACGAASPSLAYTGPACAAVTAPATGFFYTREIDGRWWFITPAGKAFYAVGVDHVNYHVFGCEKLGYAPYHRNVEALYGSEAKWAENTVTRLKDWGFNILATNNSPSLRGHGLPYIEFLSLGSSFAGKDALCRKTNWTGFPNVFSPDWPKHCDEIAQKMCAPHKDDPTLLGYFLDNELEWFGKDYKPWGLFDEAWEKPASNTAKQAWVAFLRKELGNPRVFEKLWGRPIASFDALANDTSPAPPQTDRAREIARRWVRRVAELYFQACERAIHHYDPHHLILGCRFAGKAPDIWDIAGKYCDVVSFNMYPRIDVNRGVPASVIKTIRAWHKQARKPLMITEWSFPALDTDLPSVHGAGMRVDTQAQRAQCFRHFQTLLFSLPFMIGSDYFMWVDEPALGISSSFPEDSNYGLVNVHDRPYPELTRAAQELNPRANALHLAGAVPPPATPPALATWVTRIPKSQVTLKEPLALTTGELTLHGPVDGHAWRLEQNGKRLADLYALMHIETPQTGWIASNHARIIAIHQGDQLTVVDMELSNNAPGPGHYRSGWRYIIPRNDQGWISSQCLWVENTDTSPWRLVELYHYAMPFTKPGSKGPIPLSATDYYRHGAAWGNPANGTGFGCWYADDDAFICSFWIDPHGGYHPDLRQEVDKTLKPGQRLKLDKARAFFFPVKEPTLAGFGQASIALTKAVLSRRK